MIAGSIDGRIESPEAAELVLIGCGSDCAGDDSVGLEIVRRIGGFERYERRFTAPEEATTEVRGIVSGVPYLLFVDAVSTTSRPGAIHLVSLPNASVRPRNLDCATIPPQARAALLGIEVEALTTGPELSDPVARAADFVVANIESLQRQVLTHEHENLPLAVHILAPERDLVHA
jgi:hydrogenase maturation protease